MNNTAFDSFSNVAARLGADTPNLLETTTYPNTRLSRNFNLLNSLYRSHWIIRRIIDTIPGDMCKNWYKLSTQVSPAAIDAFIRQERRTKTKAKILQGLRWGDLYGGAVGIMLISGQENDLEKPLDLSLIMPGDYKGLMIVDRWVGVYPELSLVTDFSDPDYGLPEYYQVTNNVTNTTVRVHHSRCLRFIGMELPYWEMVAENYWGSSRVETVFDELKKRDNTSWNIAQLVFLANIRALKMDQLGQTLAASDVNSQKELYNVLTSQNHIMSNMGLFVMDKEDSLEQHPYTFTGLPEVYDRFMMDISGAAGIPVTRLFGRSAAGMNATGEGDEQVYYDGIEEKQESTLQPILEKLLPVMAMSAWGAVPDDLDIIFEPVQKAKPKEAGEIAEKVSKIVVEAYNAGIVGKEVSLKELKQQADTTGVWSNITDEDIEKAKQEDTMPSTGGSLFGDLGLSTLANDAEFEESDHPRDKDGKFGSGSGSSEGKEKGLTSSNKSGKLQSSQKLEARNPKSKQKEPFNYWELAADRTTFPSRWVPTGFSNSELEQEHIDRHANEFEFASKDYVKEAKKYLTSPRGKYGDAFVSSDETIFRYDYETKHFAMANKKGTVITYMNLKKHKTDEAADLYWERQKADRR